MIVVLMKYLPSLMLNYINFNHRSSAAAHALCFTDYLLQNQNALPNVVNELIRQIAQDPSKNVQAFVLHLLAAEPIPPMQEAGPAITTTIFSRPPKAQQKLLNGMRDIHILERRMSPVTPVSDDVEPC